MADVGLGPRYYLLTHLADLRINTRPIKPIPHRVMPRVQEMSTTALKMPMDVDLPVTLNQILLLEHGKRNQS